MHVVNKRKHTDTPQDIYVGRPSPLGNRWSHRKDVVAKYPWMEWVPTREEAVARYRSWLWGQIQANNPEILAALAAIPDDAVLVCWCAPQACHGDVIKAACGWLRQSSAAD